MAFFGLSKLEAVCLLLQAIRLKRVSALDSTGAWPAKVYGNSNAADAEWTLDLISRQVQARGFGCNTVRAKKFTLGGSGTISLPANTLAIIPAGPTQFRNIGIRDDKAYDLEADTATFAAGDYFFDVITAVDFESLDPTVKDIVVAEAKQYFQAKERGDQNQHQINEGDRTKAELNAARPKPSANARALNQMPLISQPAPQGG